MAETTNTAETLKDACNGFDALFSNDLTVARERFSPAEPSAFHLLGLGVTSFLQAALGVEEEYMQQAIAALGNAETSAKNQLRIAKSEKSTTRFAAGTEWEIIQADATLLQGLTQGLSETYMGYLNCLYSMNSAHSKFTKIYKAVFPGGLSSYSTPAGSPAPSRKPSNQSLRSAAAATPPAAPRSGFFSRFTSSLTVPKPIEPQRPLEGPVEELVAAGAAFGFGVFNLVLSLLPSKIRGVVGFLGFKSDRAQALQALAVSAATGNDPHAVFSGLVLMSYYGIVLLLLGWQADEQHIIRQYLAIIDSLQTKYPKGTLWILNRAKILRYTYKPDEAIDVLVHALAPENASGFIQADALLVFELAWLLLSQRRYSEAAEAFIKMTKVNSWSHSTYYFLAMGLWMPATVFTN